MKPIDIFTVLVCYKSDWSYASEYIAETEGDAVDQLRGCPSAKEVRVIQTTVDLGEPYSRDKTPSLVGQVITAILDDHDFNSDSPPAFPNWCEPQGMRTWRRALAEMQADEAHVAGERAALAVGSY